MSDPKSQQIRLSDHARGYLERRGFSEAEVAETIRTQPWTPARNDRLEATKDFAYNDIWNGQLYATKRVRPIFVATPHEIVVVTVYTYYF
ncbi:MAG: hypothetical protein M3121_01250 [Chloroflexota bacterium]|nr:hypothetical protein [Chloroflexota bacterium]